MSWTREKLTEARNVAGLAGGIRWQARRSAASAWLRDAADEIERLQYAAALDKRTITRLADELNTERGARRWRPIAEIHEDYGPCVLMRLDDPGYLEIGSNLDLNFDETQWTHFVPVPQSWGVVQSGKILTNEEAARLLEVDHN